MKFIPDEKASMHDPVNEIFFWDKHFRFYDPSLIECASDAPQTIMTRQISVISRLENL